MDLRGLALIAVLVILSMCVLFIPKTQFSERFTIVARYAPGDCSIKDPIQVTVRELGNVYHHRIAWTLVRKGAAYDERTSVYVTAGLGLKEVRSICRPKPPGYFLGGGEDVDVHVVY